MPDKISNTSFSIISFNFDVEKFDDEDTRLLLSKFLLLFCDIILNLNVFFINKEKVNLIIWLKKVSYLFKKINESKCKEI